ncbi:MAG: PqqD family protein, partial [Roseiarcus sp.]
SQLSVSGARRSHGAISRNGTTKIINRATPSITTASRIWELLETPKTVAQLCAQLCEEFEVDEPTCEAEVLKFTGDLVDNGMVHEAAA